MHWPIGVALWNFFSPDFSYKGCNWSYNNTNSADKWVVAIYRLYFVLKYSSTYHTWKIDWIIPTWNQILRAWSSFSGIFGKMRSFVIGLQKCVLYSFFLSKISIFWVKKCWNFVIFPAFQYQNTFGLMED